MGEKRLVFSVYSRDVHDSCHHVASLSLYSCSVVPSEHLVKY